MPGYALLTFTLAKLPVPQASQAQVLCTSSLASPVITVSPKGDAVQRAVYSNRQCMKNSTQLFLFIRFQIHGTGWENPRACDFTWGGGGAVGETHTRITYRKGEAAARAAG